MATATVPTTATSAEGLSFRFTAEDASSSEDEAAVAPQQEAEELPHQSSPPQQLDREAREAADEETFEAATQLCQFEGEAVDSEGEELVPPQAKDYFHLWRSGCMDDNTVAARWGWNMVAQFVRALKMGRDSASQAAEGAQQSELARQVGPAQREVMLQTLREWKQDLFPDGGEGMDESQIVQDAPFPAGEMGYNLARFEAWHAGYITDQVVRRAGGNGLLMWFRKLAIIRKDPGVPGLAKLPGAEGDVEEDTAEDRPADEEGRDEDQDTGQAASARTLASGETSELAAAAAVDASAMAAAVEKNVEKQSAAAPDGVRSGESE